MPWKNGGGVTTEIAAFPPGSGIDDFAWRVSIADVEADGPFSSFPGVDRTIALVSGRGMRLASPSFGVRVIAEAFQPFAFRGEDAVHCTPLDGPIRDFNLMTRRALANGSLRAVTRDESIVGQGQHVVVHCVLGAVDAAMATSPAGPTDDPVTLPSGFSAVGPLRRGATLVLRWRQAGAALVAQVLPNGTRLASSARSATT
jgi:environmental stress-induced protein Ves